MYVKDGVALWEEQAAQYPQTNPSVPDYNPRGCQKGACYAAQMYDQGRVTYPLKRTGERGEGKWQQVSWDEALTAIADKIVDTLAQDGPEAVIFDGNPTGVASYVAVHRFANLLDAGRQSRSVRPCAVRGRRRSRRRAGPYSPRSCPRR